MKIAVFCSGNGTNFQAIIDAISRGYIKNAEITLAVCDNPKAFVLERARQAGIESLLIELKDFSSKLEYEKAIREKLKSNGVELIALAGYMKLVGDTLLRAYPHKILNIHPALLPSFKGTHGIDDALGYGVKVTGPTVHFVDKEVDHGPIILQEAVPVAEDDTVESLAQKIHQAEHRIYPEAIKLFVEGRLEIIGRKVKILTSLFLALVLLAGAANAQDKEVALAIKDDYSYYQHWQMDYSDDNEVDALYMLDEDSSSLNEEDLLLNDRQRLNKKIDLYFKAFDTTGEIFDSIRMPYIARSIENLIDWSKSLRSYTDNLEEKLNRRYKLRLELKGDDPYLIFRHNY